MVRSPACSKIPIPRLSTLRTEPPGQPPWQPPWGSHRAGALGPEIGHGLDFGHSSARVCQLAGHRDRRGRRPTRFTEVTFTKEK